MKISLIIPTRQGISQELKDCISNQDTKPDEIIEVIGDGLTIQRNEGIKKANGDMIIFIDDDITFNFSFISRLVRAFIYFPIAMAVSANPEIKSYKTNLFWEIYARIFMLTYRKNGKYQLSGFPTNYHPNIHNTIEAEMLHGCCMAIRKRVFDKYKFNEDLDGYMYGEDDYFANEIIKDFPIYYTPIAMCDDNRPYPKGKQAWKIRHTLFNLVKRHRMKKRNWSEKICFWWAMFGFINFKIIEAIIMRDFSIIKGMFLCFKPYKNIPVDEIRKNIKIKIYDFRKGKWGS